MLAITKITLGMEKLSISRIIIILCLVLAAQVHASTKEFCISEIASGKIDNAVSLHKSLNDSDNSKLPEIIKAVYNEYGKLDRLDNIVNFIRKLPWCSQLEIAYPALVDLLKSNNHFYNPKALYQGWAGKYGEEQTTF